MNSIAKASIACTAAVLLLAGCKKTADNTINYTNAINTYYAAHPSCLWSTPQKFPVQVAASDASKTQPYDALFDANLLTRTTTEKKIIIISRQETNYDLSPTGQSEWTADPTQPGYGNFCFGHRTVQSIVSATPNNGQPGATSEVSYLYNFSAVPAWAKSTEIQTAFPQVGSAAAGHGGASATLLDTPGGWQMQAPPPSSANPSSSNPDSQIVQ